MVDRTDLTDSQVLCALYNGSRPLGMGHLAPGSGDQMTVNRAAGILNDRTYDLRYFDYLQGRIMKIDVSENPLNPRLFDRDNGQGAAERAIAQLRDGR